MPKQQPLEGKDHQDAGTCTGQSAVGWYSLVEYAEIKVCPRKCPKAMKLTKTIATCMLLNNS